MTDDESTNALDPALEEAIVESVAAHGESEKVAKRLVQWLNELSLGRTMLGNRDETEQYFDTIRSAMTQEEDT